ncbi:MAG: T9SS C-terminal target domain-containing protein [Deltaproteobacteria bacterium]|jgi:hypothetical protein|nr:T9SS C-terminal target domain-containing protein [Deltaproteobacteria bacterium]
MPKKFHTTLFTIIFFFLALLFWIIIFPQTINAQTSIPNIEWQRSFGGSRYDDTTAIQRTSDGNYIMVGLSQSKDGDLTSNQGMDDLWVVKFNQSGKILWQKSTGGFKVEYPKSVIETSDRGFLLAGTKHAYGSFGPGFNLDYWIIRLDIKGNILWEKTFGGTRIDSASAARETYDGGFIVVGDSWSSDGDVKVNYGRNDIWVIKLDQLGNLQWEKSLGGSNDDFPNSIIITPDQGYLISGTSESNDGDVKGNLGGRGAWLIKLSEQGNIQWAKTYGGTRGDYSNDMQPTSDGGYIFVGHSYSSDGDVTKNQGDSDVWIVKLDSQGKITWQKTYGGNDSDLAYSVQETMNGGYIVAGKSKSKDGDVTGNHGNYDYWLVRVDSQGNLEWQKSFGGSEFDEVKTILMAFDGGFIVIGSSNSKNGDVKGNHGEEDIWVIKLRPQANEKFQWRANEKFPGPSPDREFKSQEREKVSGQ